MGRASRRKRELHAERESADDRRARKERQGVAQLPTGREAPWQAVFQEAWARRLEADRLEEEAVRVARSAGVSWDRIAAQVG